MSLINTTVQPFKANAFVNRTGKGEFVEITEASLKGQWSVLIFMPAAFTFNCPTEIEDAADNHAEFQKAGATRYLVAELGMTGLLLLPAVSIKFPQHVHFTMEFDRAEAASIRYWNPRRFGRLSLFDRPGLDR